jgi:hypothetical protein
MKWSGLPCTHAVGDIERVLCLQLSTYHDPRVGIMSFLAELICCVISVTRQIVLSPSSRIFSYKARDS